MIMMILMRVIITIRVVMIIMMMILKMRVIMVMMMVMMIWYKKSVSPSLQILSLKRLLRSECKNIPFNDQI